MRLLPYLVILFVPVGFALSGDDLAGKFSDPPPEARLHAYWWWLNGNVTSEAITRDLEAMKDKGIGGALITDAGGADQDGNRQVPKGPLFGSEAWRELYRHSLREGRRLNLEMGLNIQSGWNLGGPGVKPEDADKILCWTVTRITGPGAVTNKIPAPRSRNGLLREVAVLALPDLPPSGSVANWDEKTLVRPVRGANYDTSFLIPAQSDKADNLAPGPDKVVDLTKFTDVNGNLQWNVPAGTWRVYRFCYTVAPHARVSTYSEGWAGLAIDPMDSAAFQRYWDAVVQPLISDAEGVGGKVLKYVHTDSWEIEPFNWTPQLPQEFKRRCGYDLVPWLPVLAQGVLGGREASERFLHDYRKTLAALVAEGYYGPFLENAHRHGIKVRAESGGPHGVPIDAQHCLGMIDVPMSEFWATSWRHRVAEKDRFFVKQPASAAHTYGKTLVSAEGFTTIGPHWQETVWDNLKPNFDHALCEGLNQLVWTLVTCSPSAMGVPGQEMFPGTHFNPNSTWWRQSEGFLSYVNRCQWMLQQGFFVADVLYYYGDHAPNFSGHRASNPATLPPGYDYDVADEYVILNRLAVQDGRIVLPDGMSYAGLVLPPYRCMSLPVLRKLVKLAEAGAVIVGPRPDSSSGLPTWQTGDVEARALIDRIWGANGGGDSHPLLKFRDTAAWLKAGGLLPDFACVGAKPDLLHYVHRRDGATDIYFVKNPASNPVRATVSFRITGRVPEFWDPCDGSIRALPEWRETPDNRIEVPLAFEAFGSGFVVFRNRSAAPGEGRPQGAMNFPDLKPIQEVAGPWKIAFDPAWFYPDESAGGRMVFDKLVDWTHHPDPAVRYFSGAAIYRTAFDLSGAQKDDRRPVYISLGSVREMARIRINDHDLGVVWCPPWRVRIPEGVLATEGNRLEIEVVNFWPNRLIGDMKLRPEQRRTRTNITKFEKPKGDKHYTTLMPSGLLGPVRLER